MLRSDADYVYNNKTWNTDIRFIIFANLCNIFITEINQKQQDSMWVLSRLWAAVIWFQVHKCNVLLKCICCKLQRSRIIRYRSTQLANRESIGFVIQWSLVRSLGETLFLHDNWSQILRLLVICLSLLIQKSCWE